MRKRMSINDVLKIVKLDIVKLYSRAYHLFYMIVKGSDSDKISSSIANECDKCFENFQGRGRNESLAEFNQMYGFEFKLPSSCMQVGSNQTYIADLHSITEKEIDENYLINFCEYSYNIVFHTCKNKQYMNFIEEIINSLNYKMIDYVVDSVNYKVFVPRSLELLRVLESIDTKYIKPLWTYPRLKGDIKRKRSVLMQILKEFEPQFKEKTFPQEIKPLMKDLSYLYKKINIRHNNNEIEKDDNKFYKNLTEEEQEDWYDIAYELFILINLKIDYHQIQQHIEALKSKNTK